MSAQDYVSTYAGHYFDFSEAVPFFLISLAGLCVVIGIILIMARVRAEFDRSHPSGGQNFDADEDKGISAEYDLDIDSDYYAEDRERAAAAKIDQDYYTEPYEDEDDTVKYPKPSNLTSRNDRANAGSIRTRNTETRSRSRGRAPQDIRALRFMESFFEMAFASTSVLLLLALYYIINDRISGPVASLWRSYKDWMLIGFLLLSMIVNRIFDRVLVHLRNLDSKQRGSMRLISSLYVVLILMYIRFIYDDLNYENLIIYFVTLIIGRFVYFDVTWEGFRGDIFGIARNFPFLVLMVAYSGFVIWYGFHSGFLLKANGVIVSTLIAHLFMDVAIFLIDKTRILRLLCR